LCADDDNLQLAIGLLLEKCCVVDDYSSWKANVVNIM